MTAASPVLSQPVARTIKPRSPRFDWSTLPRAWFGGDPVATHVANGLNLVFPDGERFFVRSVRHYLDRIDDPRLEADVRAFFQQESRHGAAHEQQVEALRAQGYDVDAFLRFYRAVAFGVVEPLAPPALRLAVTAALEHFTAFMAHDALTDGLLDLAHPEMERLLKWHAAEEIEHKAVAFDVLRQVAPSYGVRVAGIVLASTLLTSFWTIGAASLLLQDVRAGRSLHAARRAMPADRTFLRDVLVPGIREYLRPAFHPNDRDDYALAEAFLAANGMNRAAAR